MNSEKKERNFTQTDARRKGQELIKRAAVGLHIYPQRPRARSLCNPGHDRVEGSDWGILRRWPRVDHQPAFAALSRMHHMSCAGLENPGLDSELKAEI